MLLLKSYQMFTADHRDGGRAGGATCQWAILCSRGKNTRRQGRCASEALPHAFDIGMFKYGKSNPTTIKHIYSK